MKMIMPWLWFAPVISALAMPLTWNGGPSRHVEPQLNHRGLDRTIIHPETGAIVIVGETWSARTIYTLVSTFCLIVLTLLLGKHKL